MKKLITAAAAAAAFMLAASSVLAEAPSILIEPLAVEGSRVTITGTLSSAYSGMVSYYVTAVDDNGNTDGKYYAAGNIYSSQVDGEFGGEFIMSNAAPSGKYRLVAAAVKADSGVTADFEYISENERKELIKYLTADDTEIKDIVSVLANEEDIKTLRAMSCIIDDCSALSSELKTSIASLIKSDLNGYYHGEYTEEQFVAMFNYSAAYTCTVTDSTSDIANMLKKYADIFKIDAENVKNSAYLTNKMREVRADSPESVKTAYSRALAVMAFNAEIDYKNVPSLIGKYAEIIELDTTVYNRLSAAQKLYVHKALIADPDYDTVGDIKQRFNSAVASAPSGGGTSGSGGGGGGGGSIDGAVNKYIPEKIISAAQDTQSSEKFYDLKDCEWAKEAIETLAEYKIISGVEANTFEPSRSVTREEFVKMLVSAFSLVDKSAVCEFTDVPSDAWYFMYVASAVQSGIVNGRSATEFGSGMPVTRQEIAALLVRTTDALEITLAQDEPVEFADSSELADYAAEAVSRLAAAKIIIGKEGGRFAPSDNASRAEAAKLIYELWKLYVDGE